MSEGPNAGGNQCDRCGGTFRVELCEVHRGPVPGTNRNRLEAHLCYSCRQDTTHEVIG
jgi:hypothetical protein